MKKQKLREIESKLKDCIKEKVAKNVSKRKIKSVDNVEKPKIQNEKFDFVEKTEKDAMLYVFNEIDKFMNSISKNELVKNKIDNFLPICLILKARHYFMIANSEMPQSEILRVMIDTCLMGFEDTMNLVKKNEKI
jgi:hypothetical protein